MDEMNKRLEMARALVRELEEGSHERAEQILQDIVRDTETGLFQEVGKLTRELHDTLVSVQRDSRLAGITENEIPDAKQRLHYVIEKTETAAHKTMTAVEEVMPVAEHLRQKCHSLKDDWQRFARREMELGDFKNLSKQIADFLRDTDVDMEKIQTNLSAVMLAQDYQDLTGQVIRKVIDLVQEVENKLVDLVRASGGRVSSSMPVSEIKGQGIGAEGPQIGMDDSPHVLSSQDEVDDLLSSLGF